MTNDKPHKSRSVMSWAAFLVFAGVFVYRGDEMASYGMMFIVANFCFNKTAQIIKGGRDA